MQELQIAEDRAPPSAEALEIAQRRISELELENQILREEVKKYELQLTATKENQTKPAATSRRPLSLKLVNSPFMHSSRVQSGHWID